ncbi:DUF4365 domain-containing protein [Streptomyces afghaniensis]|uniref:DUF4365 domain-containing protein n=1 Tax=Streptomyces afghaniensis TaxID=66865 RepID=UPI0037A32287
MTNRPRNHEIASLAVSAVSSEWIKIGAAVDTIHNDYGEDLLVQTSWQGEMDDSRIWVQVKGRGFIGKSKEVKSLPSLRVPRGHAMRWTNTADTVIICLWDVSRDVGWYALPQAQLSPFELLVSQDDAIRIKFSTSNRLDSAAARRITWQARMRCVTHQLSHARMLERTYREMGREDAVKGARSWAAASAYGFLLKVGLLNEDATPPAQFDQWVRNAYHNFERDGGWASREERFAGAVQLALLGHMDSIEKETGLTTVLFQELAEVMQFIYMNHHGSIDNWLSSVKVDSGD